jgi:hypothetical protein
MLRRRAEPGSAPTSLLSGPTAEASPPSASDIVVGPGAEGVQPGVELVHPLEIAVGYSDRAHLLAAYGRASWTVGKNGSIG